MVFTTIRMVVFLKSCFGPCISITPGCNLLSHIKLRLDCCFCFLLLFCIVQIIIALSFDYWLRMMFDSFPFWFSLLIVLVFHAFWLPHICCLCFDPKIYVLILWLGSGIVISFFFSHTLFAWCDAWLTGCLFLIVFCVVLSHLACQG